LQQKYVQRKYQLGGFCIMLQKIKNAGTAIKRFMLTSGDDVYNEKYYTEENDDENEYESSYEDDPMKEHYGRKSADLYSKSRVDYTEKIVSLGYAPAGHNQSRFQHYQSQQTHDTSGVVPAASIAHPKEFKDASKICDDLCSGKMVIVDLSSLDSVMAQRIADYLGGVVHTIQGNTIRVNKGIFIVAPREFDISDYSREDKKDYGTFKAVSPDRY